MQLTSERARETSIERERARDRLALIKAMWEKFIVMASASPTSSHHVLGEGTYQSFLVWLPTATSSTALAKGPA